MFQVSFGRVPFVGTRGHFGPFAIFAALSFFGALALGACGDSGGGVGPDLDAAVPDGGGVCTAGATRCLGDTQVESCLADGSGWHQTETCSGSTPVCVDGACVSCLPGEGVCADTTHRVTCLPDGSGHGDPVPCEGLTPVCLGGECVSCLPDATECADATNVVTCLGDGSGYGAPVPCDGGTPVCLDGECVSCLPDATECADATNLVMCLGDGSGYGAPVPCNGGTPVCLGGACVVCAPGSATCADGGHTQSCLPDGSGYDVPVPCGGGTPACLDGACVVCAPGSVSCAGDDQTQVCLPDGSGYGAPVACALEEGCQAGQCVNLCALSEASPSSLGCSFFAAKMDNFYSNVSDSTKHDSITLTNPHPTKTLTAQVFFVPVSSTVEQAAGPAITVPPQSGSTFVLSQAEVDSVTLLRTGGVYRIATNLPASVHHHSPQTASATNDSMLLLPEASLGGSYIVASYGASVGPYPSYLTAIGLVDNTTLQLTVPQATAGGDGVAALTAGQTATLALGRYSFLNVVVQAQQGGDLSGTLVTADQPFWLAGATECANIPSGSVYFCDYIAELMLPLEVWGSEYVGAHAPTRGGESFHWRIFAGADAVTITTDPLQTGFPVTLDKGQFHQLSTSTSVVFLADGPILPVQYLEGQTGGAGTGDPSMILAVPTEQFLDSYVYLTPTGYSTHYAQVIRPVGGAEVLIDGNLVGGFTTLGAYQIADVPVSGGVHTASSQQPFGLSAYGYTDVTSYAYPVGLRMEVINPQ